MSPTRASGGDDVQSAPPQRPRPRLLLSLLFPPLAPVLHILSHSTTRRNHSSSNMCACRRLPARRPSRGTLPADLTSELRNRSTYSKDPQRRESPLPTLGSDSLNECGCADKLGAVTVRGGAARPRAEMLRVSSSSTIFATRPFTWGSRRSDRRASLPARPLRSKTSTTERKADPRLDLLLAVDDESVTQKDPVGASHGSIEHQNEGAKPSLWSRFLDEALTLCHARVRPVRLLPQPAQQPRPRRPA